MNPNGEKREYKDPPTCRECGQEIRLIKGEKGWNRCQPKRIAVITKDGEFVLGNEPHKNYCPAAQREGGARA